MNVWGGGIFSTFETFNKVFDPQAGKYQNPTSCTLLHHPTQKSLAYFSDTLRFEISTMPSGQKYGLKKKVVSLGISQQNIPVLVPKRTQGKYTKQKQFKTDIITSFRGGCYLGIVDFLSAAHSPFPAHALTS